MARLTAPDGTVVSVDAGKVAGLVARGYTAEAAPAVAKAKPKKSASSPKSAKSSGK